VGVMDADIYGPNLPRMLGVDGNPAVRDQKIQPLEAHGVKVMSIGFMIERDQPAIWRGPIIMKVITQFLRDVAWGQLDYLIVDMPPGTGDVALSLSQSVPVAGSVVVTTPQTVSLADTKRAMRMYEKLNVPPLGLIENMSHFICPTCQTESDIFGKGGGETLAAQMNVPFLGRVPIYEPIRIGGDTGVPIVIGEPKSSAAQAFRVAAERLAAQISIASYKKSAIPLMPVR